MKKEILLIIFCIAVLFYGCREEHIARVNQLTKDLFCFKVGSEWTYYDSISQKQKTMVVQNYEEEKYSYPRRYGKTYDWGTLIKIDFSFFENLYIKIETKIGEDNTANFIGYYFSHPLKFKCNYDNSFNIEVNYLSTYKVNNIIYSDVYIFNDNVVKHFVSKNVGVIQIVSEQDNFNWVLIDKTVQQ
ncbi:MAG: hypothetical protein LBV69_00990 [Bacteroidales bacterium]|jgi:hypothetical protein|nr:hypothetical protein [Bacteroidales bacterium]